MKPVHRVQATVFFQSAAEGIPPCNPAAPEDLLFAAIFSPPRASAWMQGP